ncbi:MAG: helix-turn-helix transcriptional regulator [Clostridia bacterium]|nr:helix-turn-helix transcriptional regulator [Clostridia bacterium]
MNENKFSQIIKRLRKERGLTQQELASIVGITATGVSYWESGNSMPNTSMLDKLSEYFGVTVGYLLGKEEDVNNSKMAVLFRKAEKVSDEQKDKLIAILDSTIDIFLESDSDE